MKKHIVKKSISFALPVCVFAVASVLTVLNSCTKDKNTLNNGTNTNPAASAINQPSNTLTQVLTVANMRSYNGNNQVMFCENEEVFNVFEPAVLASLQNAYSTHSKVKVTFNPWQAIVVKVTEPANQDIIAAAHGVLSHAKGITYTYAELKNMSDDELNDASRLGSYNPSDRTESASTPRLSNVIPDMATAENLFNYLARQCCKLSGPYNVDYCISFQYVEDGCYARAEKMAYVLDNTFHYSIHKLFSFANAGNDELSVRADKWGGCCINWWYHVAPLVNINTPGGIKAYIFDPAMFDQPVLFSVWLHAQENPACAGSYNPHVSMINLQPDSSYSPTSYSGYSFDTDPGYSNTDYTLSNYASLVSCP